MDPVDSVNEKWTGGAVIERHDIYSLRWWYTRKNTQILLRTHAWINPKTVTVGLTADAAD